MRWYIEVEPLRGHKGRDLMNGISALMKETPENSLVPSTTWGVSKKTAIYEPRSRLSPDTESISALVLDFPASRTVRNKFLLFISQLIYGTVIAAWMD